MSKKQDSGSGTPRSNSAKGDKRFYPKTNVGTMPGLPQPDEANPDVIWWYGKRLYIQQFTQLRRLFYLLAKNPGIWHPVSEIQERVYKIRTDKSMGLPDDEVKRADQRLRKLVSRLENHIQEWSLDDHIVIVAKRCKKRGPGYMLLLLHEQKYKDGQAPWPSDDLDIEDWLTF